MNSLPSIFEPLLHDLIDNDILLYLNTVDFRRDLIRLKLLDDWNNCVDKISSSRNSLIIDHDYTHENNFGALKMFISELDNYHEEETEARNEIYLEITNILLNFFKYSKSVLDKDILLNDLALAEFSPAEIEKFVKLFEKLKTVSKPIKTAPKEMIENKSNPNSEIDLVILTALNEPELMAFNELISDVKDPELDVNFICKEAIFSDSNMSMKIALATPNSMGVAATLITAMQMIHYYNPKYLVLAGIAGGINGKNKNLGDIAIANQVYNYESGKIKFNEDKSVDEFLPSNTPVPINQNLWAMLSEFSEERNNVSNIQNSWKGEERDSILRIHKGSFFCGSSVIASSSKVKDFVNSDRKIVGIDMESYGVQLINKFCPTVETFIVKSYSDFADEKKDDSCRRYAAFTSAKFVKDFSLSKLSKKV